jgi:hypothetical protein
LQQRDREPPLTRSPSPVAASSLPAAPCVRSYLTIIKRVTGTKGLVGTLDGFVPWGAMQAVAKGSVFS